MLCSSRLGIDLHAHSRASDGTLTPSELVALAAERGVQVLALTDHDTTAGLAEAAAAASAHGVRFVPGIELSVLAEGKPLHIVGLGIDAASPAMQTAEARLLEIRRARAHEMGERLARLGFPDAYAGACGQAGHERPGRVHFANHLLTSGRFKDTADVFKRLLQRGKPAYGLAAA
ncbi:MAG: PHP domain-containing protein [Chromatiales bacterium]